MKVDAAALFSLALASFLAVTTEMLPVGLLPHMGATFKVSPSATGLLVSAFAIVVAVAALPLTAVCRAVDRKTVLVLTVIGYLASNILTAVGPTFAVVAAGRVVGGLAHALFVSVCIGYVPRLIGAARTGRALAIVGAGSTCGPVLGVPAATWVGTAWGWRWAFGVLAVLAAVTTLFLVCALPSVSKNSGRVLAASGADRPQLTKVALANGCAFMAFSGVFTYVSVALLAAGAGEGTVAPILLLCGCCSFVGLFLTGRTVDRYPRGTLVVALSVMVVALVAIGFSSSVLALLAAAVMVLNAAFGGLPPAYQSAAVRAWRSTPELAGALINASANAGVTLGSAAGAVLLPRFGVAGMAWVGAAVIACAMVLALLPSIGTTFRPSRDHT